MAGSGGAGGRTLEQTPTWAVATVCALFVIISVLIEHGIHSLGKLFQKRRKKAMAEALEKIKAELMLLGFISLLLTLGTKYIPDICISKHVGKTMLPCKYEDGGKYGEDKGKGESGDRRRLLDGASACGADKVEFISTNGMHDLHIFIFLLAVFHILYSIVTIVLAKAKMNKWKAWELETTTLEYQYTTDPSRFRFTHQTSFVKQHSGVSRTSGLRWIVAFFGQFFSSVTKVDYLTMRRGFINAHFAPDSKFDFHKYIKRSMEDDFKVVVGISIPLWIVAIILLLVNVEKWHTLTWLSFVPLAILLLVGTKLELIMMEMAQEIQERSNVVRGAPIVEPNNKYFWFNRPHWVLLLIHYTLFQNAFQMAYFLWVLMTLGAKSCLHQEMWITVTKVVVSIVLQFLCSYITFPLYALVTQMGSHMKKSIFEEQTTNALRKWRKAAAKQRKKQKKLGQPDASPTPSYMSGETTPSQASSPIHLLHKHKFRSSQGDVESVPNSPGYLSDTALSEIDFESKIQHESQAEPDDAIHNFEFSFSI